MRSQAFFTAILVTIFVALPSIATGADFRSSREAEESIYKLATEFESRGDHKSQFAHIYAITIAATSAELQNGAFENPEWVEALVVNYANIYRRTLARELNGNREALPVAWQNEFAYTEKDTWRATLDLIYGIKVHITRDLVEALYVTPTNFENASIRRDFFKITEILDRSMPQIWDVFLRHSKTMSFISVFTAPAVSNWIGGLREQAWNDARRTAQASKADKIEYLNRLDRDSMNSAKTFGLLLLLQF